MTVAVASSFFLRAIALYVPLAALGAVWLWRRPGHRARTGAFLATLWNVPALLGLQVLASFLGWWQFDPDTAGGLLGLPIDVYLGWLLLWGALPALALPRLPLPWLVGLALGFDLLYMPRAQPLLGLNDGWLVGEAVGVAICLVPAQLLARWTSADRRLGPRVVLQVIAFTGLLMGVVPIVALQQAGADWRPLFDRPLWQLSLIAQVLAVPAILGLSAVQEFALRGGGTPLPFDPPRRLVTSGPYAYLANPMQAAACLMLVGAGGGARVWLAGRGGADRRGLRRWAGRLARAHPDARSVRRGLACISARCPRLVAALATIRLS